MNFLGIFLNAAVFVSLCSFSYGAEQKSQSAIPESVSQPSQNLPGTKTNNIKILADQMECDDKQNKCIATGNAVAQKTNDPKNSTISAHVLIAYFSPKEPGKSSQLIRIEAEGDVVITTGNTIIRAPRGYYKVTEEYAELFEDVRVTNSGKNQLNGTHGDVFFDTGHYKVTSEGKQVQALLFSKS